MSEDHGRISERSYGKHQKSLPTVPSNSILDTQSLDRQSLSSPHPSSSHHVDEKNGPTDWELKVPREEDSDSDKYVLSAPTSVFHPSGQTRHVLEIGENSIRLEPVDSGSSSRPFISFVNLASRLYSHQLQRNAGRSRLSVPLAGEYTRDPSASLIEISSQPMSRQSRMALESFALESRRRVQPNPDTERFRW